MNAKQKIVHGRRPINIHVNLALQRSLLKMYTMLTGIRNVKFYKSAFEYNVYHRCLCYFLNHAMGFRVWGRNSIKNHSLTLLEN